MGCNNFLTERIDKLIEASIRGENSGFSQETLESVMSEVEEAIHNDSVRCLENHVENAIENINEQLSQQQEITELDKLDQEVWPTHQQLDEMVEIGEALGVDETEIIRTPLICATPGVEGVKELIHDMMWALHTQDKIPPWYRDDKVFTKIMFVDATPVGITGAKVADFNPVTGVLHIYRNVEGRFPTREELKNDILTHEIFHANRDTFMSRITRHLVEWEMVKGLEDKEFPSKYAEEIHRARIAGEVTWERKEEELAAEFFRRYVKGECSETTKEFFDKFFSEEWEEEEV